MKNTNWIVLSFAGLLCLGLTSCQLAEEKTAADQADTLIGGVVTLGPVEDAIDWEKYREAHPEAAAGKEDPTLTDLQEYENRIYADKETQTYYDTATHETVEQEVYTFPAVEGVFFTYEIERDEEKALVSVKSAPNLGFWEGSVSSGSTNDKQPDETWSVEMAGTVYYAAQAEEPIITLSRVYRTPEGEVYLSSGGTSIQGDGMTALYGEFNAVEIQGRESKEEINLQVTAKRKHPAQCILLVQMDSQDREVTRQEYLPGQLPETLTPEAATDYFLIESCYTDSQGQETIERQLFEASEEYLYTPYLMENGFFAAQPTKVLWQKG